MLKKKCPACNKKIERKFNFCPWCGNSFRRQIEEENFGMLGNNDELEQQINNQLKLPFGMNSIFNSLIKQVEKELSSMEGTLPSNVSPRGFKIQISSGKPKITPEQNRSSSRQIKTIASRDISDKEKERRLNLPRVEAKSLVRRLPEGIIYEIDAPGVKSIKDIVITKLEGSIEVKIYTDKKCYVKNLPLKMELLEFSVKPGKVFLKLGSN